MNGTNVNVYWHQQMEELLKEVVLSERRKQQIDSFIQTVTELLQTVPNSPEVEVRIALAEVLHDKVDPFWSPPGSTHRNL